MSFLLRLLLRGRLLDPLYQGTTLPSDIFVPQAVGEKFRTWTYEKSALIGSGAVADVTDLTDWSQGGNTVTVVDINGFDAEAVVNTPADASEVPAAKFTTGTRTVNVQDKSLSVECHTKTIQDIHRGVMPWDEVMLQAAGAFVNSYHKSLVTDASATDLSLDVSGVTTGLISYDAVIDAQSLWGDAADDIPSLLVVHSKVAKDILKSSEVKASNNGQVIRDGRIVVFAGRPLFVSDAIKKSGTGANIKYENLLVQREALAWAIKQQVEFTFQQKYRAPHITALTASVRFLTYLRGGPRQRAIKIVTKAS